LSSAADEPEDETRGPERVGSLPGRAQRLLAAPLRYAQIAWWGLVSPRVVETRDLVVLQAVILDGDRLLLAVRNDLLGWELPGGTLEPGESPEAAMIREIREETGLEVEIERHVGDWARTGFRPHTARVYRCRPVGGTLRPSAETPVLGFFDPRRPPSGLLPWYREPLARALEAGAGAVERAERWGAGAILTAMRIDLGMRLWGARSRPD